jgi:hypothetical protein
VPLPNRIFLLASFFFIASPGFSQDSATAVLPRAKSPDTTAPLPRAKPSDTTAPHRPRIFSGAEPVDLIDIGRNLFLRQAGVRMDTSGKKAGKLYPAILPSAEYTLETGLAFDLTGSLAFYTGEQTDDNISNIYLASVFTQKNQILMPLQGNIWTKGNKYNIVTDWRFEIFPQDTYGLGTLTTVNDADAIDYTYLRFYSTLLKTIRKDLYLGLGYDVDYFWKIREVNPPPNLQPTDFEKYGLTSKSISSGPILPSWAATLPGSPF